MTEAVPEKFSRDMGLTEREFLRTLPAAVAPLAYRIEGRVVTVDHPQGEIIFRLHQSRERRIASLSLPVTRVDFSFAGLDEAIRARFLERFDLCFHRGGG
ncbi:MAG: hypothetical protein KDI68_15860 [Gammaproteobacteria bacterium]|nr:hypothetical protein [Gammaproteobacteria bacterium]